MNKLAPSGPENEQTEINEVIIYNINTNMILKYTVLTVSRPKIVPHIQNKSHTNWKMFWKCLKDL